MVMVSMVREAARGRIGIGKSAIEGKPRIPVPARNVTEHAPRATTDDMDLAAMIYAHIRAIDVAHAAESYAAERGLAIRYTSEDVRCIAAALFIQQSKGGAR